MYLLFNVCGESVLTFVLVIMHDFVSFLVSNLDKEERAGCFVFLMSCYCYALWLFLMVMWVGLQCVIVVFPDHTRLLFDPDQTDS